MQTQPSHPPKPVTDWWRPDLVALPKLTLGRRLFRVFIRGLARLVVFVTLKNTIRGLENLPKRGPALIVINHLGDADAVLFAASLPVAVEGLGKIELNDHWLVGPILRAYGVIWVHRGRPDRRAIRAALDGLAEGRMVSIAPEGRESVGKGLEEGTEGAAFLALRSGAPIVPVAMTGTENETIYGNLRKWRRSRVTLSVGKPFFLREQAEGRIPNRDEESLESMKRDRILLREGTRQIMEALADLLPESYRGAYK